MDRPLVFTLSLAFLIFFSLAPYSDATTYMVGDTSGWDISTDLDTWPQGKTFHVGDVLVFQYSSSDSVEELSKEYYDNCTTTRALETFSSGNTSIPLTRPGPWYFSSGNRLYCLGGMKLQLNVEEDNGWAAGPPASSPSESPAALTQPSTKSDNPFNPTSDAQRLLVPRPPSLLLHLVLSLSLSVMLRGLTRWTNKDM
ncbi:hypothetical protein MLD38_019817 [Melastoma candidum]|uniref:Uncharacterized protein n=1 Tax=Melastoma candidum TaxID=119954 RepID=A0ACB9QCD2_9MYRT|nr:hypothetical protein MLD38_019817 [Melastoma candidum]